MDHTTNGPTRRSLITIAGGSLLLAGCASTDDSTGSKASTPSATAPSASAPSATAPGAASTPSSAPASTSPQAIVALSAVPVGKAVAAKLDGKPIIVSQPTAGTVKAFSAICTHQGCTVAPSGAKLDCPCHGSVFNALTGAVLNGPATQPLPPVAVTVSGDSVVAGT